MGAAVFCCFWARVSRYPDYFSHFQFRILGDLAEQAHESVLQITERTISAHGAIKTVEFFVSIFVEIHCGGAGHHARICEFSNALWKKWTVRIGKFIVEPFVLCTIVSFSKSGKIGGIGEISAHSQNEGATIFLLRNRINITGVF